MLNLVPLYGVPGIHSCFRGNDKVAVGRAPTYSCVARFDATVVG